MDEPAIVIVTSLEESEMQAAVKGLRNAVTIQKGFEIKCCSRVCLLAL